MKKIMYHLSAIVLIIAGLIVLDGCYPQDSISVSETDIVLTGHYDSVDFKVFKTYYLPDTVFPVRDDTTDKTPVPSSDHILEQIERNMTNYGYTRVYYSDTITKEPDLMLAVAAITVSVVNRYGL